MHILISLLVDGLVLFFKYIWLRALFLHFVKIEWIRLLPVVLLGGFKLTLRNNGRLLDVTLLDLPPIYRCLGHGSPLGLGSWHVILQNHHLVLRAVKARPVKLG